MKIKCPHCYVDNDIKFADEISCAECNKSFKGFKFSRRKLVSTATALLVGGYVSYKINGVIAQERYPIEYEYAIVNTCVNLRYNLLSDEQVNKKREICLCALKNTQQDISYVNYRSDSSLFIAHFNKNLDDCKI